MDLLIVDDERTVRFGVKKAVKRLELAVGEAESGEEALALLAREPAAVALVDMNMAGLNGLETIARITAEIPEPPLCIMLTAYGSERLAVEAMKQGAFDYLTKPYDVEELRLAVERALARRRLENENRELRGKLAALGRDGSPLLGSSAAMERVWNRLRKAGPADVTVLLTGESGTGKELAARALHDLSGRREKSFVSTNCAAIPDDLIESELFGHEKGAFTGAVDARPGKFELADGGTLFLDEVGDMSLPTQAKVLRALQERRIQRLGSTEERPVDVRVIAATHRNLAQMMTEGHFREDLYYRLAVVEIAMPPLRDHPEDIPLLASHFVATACERFGTPQKTLSKRLQKALTQAPWKGNVRQLKNAVESAVVMSERDELDLDDFEALARLAEAHGKADAMALPVVDFDLSFREAKRIWVDRFERAWIERTLERCDGNISKAARLLDMHRQSLQQKLRSLGIAAKGEPGE